MTDDEWVLPCGCIARNIGDTFVFEACALGEQCEYVQFVLAEAGEAEKPLTVLDMREP